ncbi:MAG TPA: SRPBCC family protein [Thermoanaerobaculia bacterium]|nr:SRPBCC family protein [Thermoanaerobaculia bacterium]
MEITKSFVVKAPAAAVWEFLIDPYRVGKCLPGAAVTEKLDEQTYAGTITIKVGPVTASYRGKLRFERLDPVAMEADLSASGQETKGKGGADMRMKSRVVARGPAETEVTVVSDVNVMGVLAQFGRGMIQDVSDQLFQKFTDGMRRELEAPPAAATPPVVETAAVEASPGAPAPAASAPSPSPSSVPAPAAPPPAAENVLDVGSLGAKAASRAAGRILRTPGFWIAVIVLALLVYWFTYR